LTVSISPIELTPSPLADNGDHQKAGCGARPNIGLRSVAMEKAAGSSC